MMFEEILKRMSKIKMRYVAQIEIDDWVEENEKTLPIDEVKKNVMELDTEIKRELENYFISENGKVTVTQMYKDVWRVDDDMEEVSGAK